MLIGLTDLGKNIENRDKSKITNPFLFFVKMETIYKFNKLEIDF